MRLALKAREDVYGKIAVQTLQDAGDYVAAEQKKQDMDAKSIDFLRLKKEAEAGVADAVTALAMTEQKRAIDLVAAQNKEHDASTQYLNDLSKMQSDLDKLNGKDQSIIDTDTKLRDGLTKETTLRDKLSLAWAQQNATAISGLSQEIQLQAQLNKRLQDEIDLRNRQGELTGAIVGYNSGYDANGNWVDTPIYANGYANQQAKNGYVSNSQLTGSGSTSAATIQNSPFVGLNSPINGWTGPSFDVGTPYVQRDMIAKVHKGERIVTAADNASGKYGSTGTTHMNFGDVTLSFPGVQKEADARSAARAFYQELKTIQGRQRT